MPGVWNRRTALGGTRLAGGVLVGSDVRHGVWRRLQRPALDRLRTFWDGKSWHDPGPVHDVLWRRDVFRRARGRHDLRPYTQLREFVCGRSYLLRNRVLTVLRRRPLTRPAFGACS